METGIVTKWLDRLTERSTRGIARCSSRRGALRNLGALLVGMSALPALPVARAGGGTNQPEESGGDPARCDYWRYCAVDGFLCSCCGGSPSSCPPGTEMSPITWIGTCRNPVDGKNYLISYNDCCGKTGCGNCLCTRNEGDRPLYRPNVANDLNWCLGTKSAVYHCTTALVIGRPLEGSDE